MTDTLETPVLSAEPPPRRNNPRRTPFVVVAVLAVVILGIVALAAITRDDRTTMMANTGMPDSMMGGSMMGGPMMDHSSSSPTIPGAREISVRASALSFVPNEIHVNAGEDVTIVLTAGDITHDFTIDEFAFHVTAAPGQEGRGSFRAPSTSGRYSAYCSVAGHRQAGMTATVVVDPR